MWIAPCEYVPRRYGHAYQCDMCIMETVWRFLSCGKTFGLYRAMDMMQSMTAYREGSFYHDQ